MSDPVSVSTDDLCAPTGLEVTGKTADSVTLGWNEVTGAEASLLPWPHVASRRLLKPIHALSPRVRHNCEQPMDAH